MVYWSRSDIARRIGVRPDTLSKYDLPMPDVYIGTQERNTRGWLPETVEAWIRSRPGQGARTDLRK